MKPVLCLTALLLLGACVDRSAWISPSDPDYQRTGAPRVGEPVPQPNNYYGRISGPGDHDSP